MDLKETTISTDFDVFPADFNPTKGKYGKKLKKCKKKKKKKLIIRQGPDYWASAQMGIE